METQDNRGREYRYQKSITIGNEMFVVRADSWDDFSTEVKNMQTLVPQTKAFPDDNAGGNATPPQKVAGQIPHCSYHKSPMAWKTGISKKTGSEYAFWSCSQRMPDGSYCKAKPEVK